MDYRIYLIIVLLIISSISKAIMDTLNFHFDKSIFKNLNSKWFNSPNVTWKNKYKNGDKKQGEKFLGSSTIFVSLTDGWHLFGLIRDLSIYSCIAIISNNYWILLGYPIYRGVFHLFFTYIFTKK